MFPQLSLSFCKKKINLIKQQNYTHYLAVGLLDFIYTTSAVALAMLVWLLKLLV